MLVPTFCSIEVMVSHVNCHLGEINNSLVIALGRLVVGGTEAIGKLQSD